MLWACCSRCCCWRAVGRRSAVWALCGGWRASTTAPAESTNPPRLRRDPPPPQTCVQLSASQIEEEGVLAAWGRLYGTWEERTGSLLQGAASSAVQEQASGEPTCFPAAASGSAAAAAAAAAATDGAAAAAAAATSSAAAAATSSPPPPGAPNSTPPRHISRLTRAASSRRPCRRRAAPRAWAPVSCATPGSSRPTCWCWGRGAWAACRGGWWVPALAGGGLCARAWLPRCLHQPGLRAGGSWGTPAACQNIQRDRPPTRPPTQLAAAGAAVADGAAGPWPPPWAWAPCQTTACATWTPAPWWWCVTECAFCSGAPQFRQLALSFRPYALNCVPSSLPRDISLV